MISGFLVSGFWFRVSGLELRFQGFMVRVEGTHRSRRSRRGTRRMCQREILSVRERVRECVKEGERECVRERETRAVS